MGTLNSRLQSVQTLTAGVVLSHLTTLRRRWTMDISSFAFGIPRCLGSEGVNLTAAASLPAHAFPTLPNDERQNGKSRNRVCPPQPRSWLRTRRNPRSPRLPHSPVPLATGQHSHRPVRRSFAITVNCQKQARFTPMNARNAPKLSNSPACS